MLSVVFSSSLLADVEVILPKRASQVYLYFSAVTPPTILVTGPFTPQVFSPGRLVEAEQDCRISPFLFLRRNTRLAEVG